MRIAAVQSAPVFLDRAATLARVLGILDNAHGRGVELIAFPEGYLPGHPGWVELLPFDDRSLELGRQLFEAAVEVPGEEVDAVARHCGELGIACVLGICERRRATTGTLFNAQILIDRDGRLAGKHQKFVPTIGERLAHAPGQTKTANSMVFDGEHVVTSLICGENSNPLAQYSTSLTYPAVHAASWPQHFSPAVPMRPVIEFVSRGLAYTLKSFVLNAVTCIGPEMLAAYGGDAEAEAFLADPETSGRASIVAPSGSVLAVADGPGEQLVIADVDPREVVLLKQVHDFAGHYNRPELFAELFEPADDAG
jgi:aliphatic nitrilase